MAAKPEALSPTPSPNRLWAEQLAIGMGLFLGLLIFMALAHPKILSSGAEILGPNDMKAYGLASVVGVLLQIVVHELGSIVALWRMKIPVRLRFFGFGANATASLEQHPRNVWTDAVVGMAGPLTGTILSVGFAGIYEITRMQDASPVHVGNPFFLGMACVGYFYNLITLIPILDLEGGWIAPALAPQAWLVGLVASVLELTNVFNLVLLGVVAFTLPRFLQLLRARVPRTDVACTHQQRVIIGVGYFLLVIGLGWFSSTTFAVMPELVRNAMGD